LLELLAKELAWGVIIGDRLGFDAAAIARGMLGNLIRTLYNTGMPEKEYCVYIMSNQNDDVFYTGMTSNLSERLKKHKSGHGGRFTRKYAVNKLVYYEICPDSASALRREKQIKARSRQRKIALVTQMNPAWRDLAEDL